MAEPLATFIHDATNLNATLEFLKRTRSELRELRYVRVWPDRLQIFDINNDYFEIHHIGYPHADIVAVLQAINTAFDPAKIHDTTILEFKEYKTGRRYTWAHDRVM